MSDCNGKTSYCNLENPFKIRKFKSKQRNMTIISTTNQMVMWRIILSSDFKYALVAPSLHKNNNFTVSFHCRIICILTISLSF